MKRASELLIFSSAVIFLFSACGSTEKPVPAGKTVSAPTITAAKEKVLLTRRFPGRVEAKTHIVLSSKISGTITALDVEEGDRVTTGARLITVDDRELKHKMEALQAELDAVRRSREATAARTVYAQAQFKRFAQLIKEDAVTPEEFDRVKAEYESVAKQELSLAAQEKALKARYEELKALLSYAQITAPAAGVVVKRFVDPGAFVSAGQPLIALDNEDAGFWFVTAVDEALIKHDGGKHLVQISIPSRSMYLTTPLASVVPRVDPATRSFTVKADLSGQTLHSGMYGSLHWPLGEEEKLLIPVSAIVRRGDLTAVYVAGSDRKIHFRMITTGRYFNKTRLQDKITFSAVDVSPENLAQVGADLWVDVLSGLEPQEVIVASDIHAVSEGDILK